MNCRQLLWPADERPAPHILKAAGMADIVKFSREELEALFGESAGDSFVAGLLFGLGTQAIGSAAFSDWLAVPGNLEAALAFAARCGAYTAMHFGAFDALPTIDRLQHLVPETGRV
ncbi:hypothetical protein [Marinobacter panjinensis]|uniref:hypothetical protein n=1 Tax=Marinobacter panjinensis TaxID=2576384 RepID=UPI0021ACEDD8|nr:hypothetical protein [Marinobacter panjinensis]MCR8914587.1 hypothetical protein [Marinobacter panjinensis]